MDPIEVRFVYLDAQVLVYVVNGIFYDFMQVPATEHMSIVYYDVVLYIILSTF